MLEKNCLERFLFVENLTRGRERAEAKGKLRTELIHWLSLWRDVLLTTLKSSTPLINLDHQEEIQSIAKQVNSRKAAQVVADLEHSFIRLNNANLQIMMDNLLLKWPML